MRLLNFSEVINPKNKYDSNDQRNRIFITVVKVSQMHDSRMEAQGASTVYIRNS